MTAGAVANGTSDPEDDAAGQTLAPPAGRATLRPGSAALGGIRVCDFTGQLAGAGATRFMAAFGAEVIRIEDPVNQGRWDILRGGPPFVDKRRGIDMGGAFNNHNAGKLGITLNLRTDRAKELLRQLVELSDVVCDNFAAGVLDRLGFGYEQLRAINPKVVYVSNSGLGATGPYRRFKTWGPVVQALCGLTFSSGLPDLEPAGWGYSYMDHMGANFMAVAILAGVLQARRTGESQWIDMACVEPGLVLTGPCLLDDTVNGRPLRRPGMPNSNRSQTPAMAPHGIYPARGEDNWVAIACRDDDDWSAMAGAMGLEGAAAAQWATRERRLADEDALDKQVASWTAERDREETVAALRRAGVPVAPVARPGERIDDDPTTREWGLWPTVHHSAIGDVRVEGLPVHLSETDWTIEHGAPCLGEHNDLVFGDLLGLDAAEIASLHDEGVI